MAQDLSTLTQQPACWWCLGLPVVSDAWHVVHRLGREDVFLVLSQHREETAAGVLKSLCSEKDAQRLEGALAAR